MMRPKGPSAFFKSRLFMRYMTACVLRGLEGNANNAKWTKALYHSLLLFYLLSMFLFSCSVP